MDLLLQFFVIFVVRLPVWLRPRREAFFCGKASTAFSGFNGMLALDAGGRGVT